MRSAATSGGALGSFNLVDRSCRCLVASTASAPTATADTSSSSWDPMGRSSEMATNPRAEPCPATASLATWSIAGTFGMSTCGPRCTLLLGVSGLASSTSCLTLRRTGRIATSGTSGPFPRAQWVRLSAPPLIEAACFTAPARASPQTAEEEMMIGGRRIEEHEEGPRTGAVKEG